MGQRRTGDFSVNFFSLQLQLKSLLEGAGGDGAAEMLDKLSELSRSEQKIVLGIFNRVLARLKEADIRVESLEDRELSEFEETLYDDLLQAINEAVNCPVRASRLEVLDGGKDAQKESPSPSDENLIDLDSARRSRNARKAAPELVN